MAALNSTILEKAWLEASNDFQQRIPNPAVSGMAACVEGIFDPYNNDLYNEFSHLLNGIMMTYVRSKRFDNPLRELKKPARLFGSTERQVASKWLSSHAFNPSDETLLRLEAPEFEEWFFSVNYKTRYEFSWSRTDMRRAFTEDGYGFNELLQATLDAQISSDQYDEMQTMIQMFAEAEQRWGLFKTNLSAAPTTEATSRELLVKIKSAAGRLKFPSKLYNAIDVPVFETPETLILWTTPDTDSYLDVMALAELFHVDRAEVNFKKIMIPEFPIPNVHAALTSDDFIYMRDVEYGVYPFWNPGTLTDKYYLHHQAMVGANPAANCILFTTGSATTIPTITMTASGIVFTPDTGTITPGGTLDTHIFLQGSVSASSGGTGVVGVEPDAATYELSAVDGSNNALQLNNRTYVDENGVLHCQKTGISAGAVITITATAAYVNPSGATSTYTDTFTATVV